MFLVPRCERAAGPGVISFRPGRRHTPPEEPVLNGQPHNKMGPGGSQKQKPPEQTVTRCQCGENAWLGRPWCAFCGRKLPKPEAKDAR